jgi:hypothetical protein
MDQPNHSDKATADTNDASHDSHAVHSDKDMLIHVAISMNSISKWIISKIRSNAISNRSSRKSKLKIIINNKIKSSKKAYQGRLA